MDGVNCKGAQVQALIAAALEGKLTDPQAERLARLDDGLLKLVLLAAAKRIAELQAKLAGLQAVDPATPSGQRPIYTKPAAPKRKRKPGAGRSHPGTRRLKPQRIMRALSA